MVLRVLISGASIAGPAVAHWLLKFVPDTEITLVERAPALRINGQGVDVRNTAIDIMKWMGIEPAVREKSTKEAGVAFINGEGKTMFAMDATGETDRQAFTSEYEIFRGDLAKIIYATIENRIKVVFGEHITSMRDESDGMHVEFSNGMQPAVYDLVVGADGMGSRTRSIAFHTTTRDQLYPLNCFFGFYTIKEDMLRGDKRAHWYGAPGGRLYFLRPDPTRVTRASIGLIFPKGQRGRPQLEKLLEAEKKGPQALKDSLATALRGAGGEMDRVIASMYEADDFYASEVAQIRTDNYVRGRVGLVGDAGYAPSPMSGMGTSLALIGAYIFAGEVATALNKHKQQTRLSSSATEKDADPISKDDLAAGLREYERLMKPIVKECQQLAPGAPQSLNPQSRWRLKLLHCILWVLFTFKLDRLFSKIVGTVSMGSDKFKLPQYSFA